MKKIFVVLASCLFLFSSCLNITEELFLEKDGSGRYVTTIDMKKLLEMMDQFKQFAPADAKGDTKDLLKPLNDSMQHMVSDLSKIEGISDVKTERPDSGTYRISMRFANLKALNEVMRKKQKDRVGDYYTMERKSFSCNDNSMSALGDVMKGLDNQKNIPTPDGQQIDMEQVKGMLKMFDMGMKYKTIYHFPRKVKDYSNKSAVLSDNGKTLTLELDMLEDSKDKTLANTIKLK